MNKAELKFDDTAKCNSIFVNGKPKFCAFKNPIPLQSNLGALSIMNFSCNENCPLFKQEKNTVSILCGCEKIVYLIEEKKDSSIVKM